MTTTDPMLTPEVRRVMADAAARARALGHSLSAFRRWPAMDGGGYTVYIADCTADDTEFTCCQGECLVTVHDDRYNLNRVHAHGTALQYSHRELLQHGYSERDAPR
jgi:hypothetical protein